MSAIPNLYYNMWSKSPATLRAQAALLADIIYGHLVARLSTASAHRTWDGPAIVAALTHFVFRVASASASTSAGGPPPSVFIRALVLVAQYTKSRRRAVVAFEDEALLLYLAAFSLVAGAMHPRLTPARLYHLHQYPAAKPGVVALYAAILRPAFAGADDAAAPALVPYLQSFMHHYLAPFIPAEYQRTDTIPLDDTLDLEDIRPRRVPREEQEFLVTSARSSLAPIVEEADASEDEDGSGLWAGAQEPGGAAGAAPRQRTFYLDSDESTSSLDLQHHISLRAFSHEFRDRGRYYRRKWLSNVKNAVRYSKARWRSPIPRARW